ncbi:hypothetical protein [Vibrio sp. CAU 1672]|uniref:hypothetical protein n=1 Tax=Vibrio sp. CAU 1672 TaxID=3032594 RepID=UPI0023DC7202|nr:hypothetical protein [Vibrio sp. CAU 1672]MDF2153564.1 hypothetical protein [Vibrio sp. CAU 1672]
MSLFRNTQKLTQAREDHLTEFFAACLNSSDQFSNAFVQLVFGQECTKQLVSVETQSIYPNCRPDMKLVFDDKTILLCENKLDAMETVGNEHTDYLQQLERYLKLDVDGVMYIRTSLKPPSPSVLNHPRYLKPEDKSHFLWRDFYDLLVGDSNPLVQELKSGFEYMGFVPPNPTIGDLSRQAPREQRENFSKFWGTTEVRAQQGGWKIGVGDIVERYFEHENANLASTVYVNPIKPERFLVRLTANPNRQEDIYQAVKRLDFGSEVSICKRTVDRTHGKDPVVDIEAPMSTILPSTLTTVESIEKQLHDFVIPLLRIAQQV